MRNPQSGRVQNGPNESELRTKGKLPKLNSCSATTLGKDPHASHASFPKSSVHKIESPWQAASAQLQRPPLFPFHHHPEGWDLFNCLPLKVHGKKTQQTNSRKEDPPANTSTSFVPHPINPTALRALGRELQVWLSDGPPETEPTRFGPENERSESRPVEPAKTNWKSQKT